MHNLLHAIKNKFASNPLISSLVGRTSYGKVSRKLDVADGAVVVITLLGDRLEDGYGSVSNSLDLAMLQFSVYSVGLNNAQTTLENIVTAFNRQSWTDVSKYTARLVQRGIVTEPEDKNSNSIFNCFAVFEFTVQ